MFKFCPQCAKDSLTFVDKHYITCKQCDFLYFHNVASSCAAIITVKNKVLLTKRAKNPGKGMWDLPGGFVDPNENLEQALSREIQEELGIELNEFTYLMSQTNRYHYQGIDYNTCDCIFSVQLTAIPAINFDPSEIAEIEWQELSSINLDNIAFPSIRAAIVAYQD